MTDRNRATTLRLRTPTQAPGPEGQLAPRPYSPIPARGAAEPRRQVVQTFTPRRPDPTSQAILAELAALGLVDGEEPG